jgi:hypothetical protein
MIRTRPPAARAHLPRFRDRLASVRVATPVVKAGPSENIHKSRFNSSARASSVGGTQPVDNSTVPDCLTVAHRCDNHTRRGAPGLGAL